MSRLYYTGLGQSGRSRLYCKDKNEYSFDYKNQVWIKGGVYIDCGHPDQMKCSCFGRLNKGKKAIITKDCH
jgi:hypothetical protein